MIDGHNDLLFALRTAREEGRDPDVAEACPEFHTDLPRLSRGGVGGQFWSVFVPSDLPADQAVTQTLEQIDSFYELVRRHPAMLEVARTADDVERISAAGRVASMIGVEGGHSIGNSLGTLRMLARMGAGYMTLTHNDETPWADSATGRHPHGGLTRFGEEVVRELNRCGILVDLSHVSPDTMRQAIEVSRAPVIFSHSSARALCDVPRDVPDDVLEAAGRSGAVVMVTFVPAFIAPEGAGVYARGAVEIERLRALHPDDPRAVSFALNRWFDANDVPATLEQVADHFDHVREVAGIDHVGMGSDFDGAPTMPKGLEDVSRFPELLAELAARGYTDEELTKIARRNVLRVMRESERISAELVAQGPASAATAASMEG